MSCGAVRPDVPASAAAHCLTLYFLQGENPKEKPPTEALAMSSVSVISSAAFSFFPFYKLKDYETKF